MEGTTVGAGGMRPDVGLEASFLDKVSSYCVPILYQRLEGSEIFLEQMLRLTGSLTVTEDGTLTTLICI